MKTMNFQIKVWKCKKHLKFNKKTKWIFKININSKYNKIIIYFFNRINNNINNLLINKISFNNRIIIKIFNSNNNFNIFKINMKINILKMMINKIFRCNSYNTNIINWFLKLSKKSKI